MHPQEILSRLGASPLKALSQNFLTSPHWAHKLALAAIHPDAEVYWEIGPGLGALTEQLRNAIQKPLILFEFDRKLCANLRDTYPDIPLIEGDVMDADFASLCEGKKISVLSNLPYHLSSPILFKLIEIRAQIVSLVLTFQKEYADRLVAKVGDDNYGALSVITQLYFQIQNLGVIPPGAFYPPPSVSSQALKLIPLKDVQYDPVQVIGIVKAAFQQPRKKMVSNLKNAFPDIPWSAHLQTMALLETVRAEELSLAQFKQLAQLVIKR